MVLFASKLLSRLFFSAVNYQLPVTECRLPTTAPTSPLKLSDDAADLLQR